jgi:uncharacterized phage infection (PIP) family protein YhgE
MMANLAGSTGDGIHLLLPPSFIQILLYFNSNIYDILLFFSTSLGLIYIPEWVEAILCSLKSFVGIIFALIFHKKMEETLEQNLLKVETATYLGTFPMKIPQEQ